MSHKTADQSWSEISTAAAVGSLPRYRNSPLRLLKTPQRTKRRNWFPIEY